jgi:hypothetical protein
MTMRGMLKWVQMEYEGGTLHNPYPLTIIMKTARREDSMHLMAMGQKALTSYPTTIQNRESRRALLMVPLQ